MPNSTVTHIMPVEVGQTGEGIWLLEAPVLLTRPSNIPTKEECCHAISFPGHMGNELGAWEEMNWSGVTTLVKCIHLPNNYTSLGFTLEYHSIFKGFHMQ